MTSMDQTDRTATPPAAAEAAGVALSVRSLGRCARAAGAEPHVLGEIMSKQWIDSAVPATFMVLVIGLVSEVVAPGFFTGANISGRRAAARRVRPGGARHDGRHHGRRHRFERRLDHSPSAILTALGALQPVRLAGRGDPALRDRGLRLPAGSTERSDRLLSGFEAPFSHPGQPDHHSRPGRCAAARVRGRYIGGFL